MRRNIKISLKPIPHETAQPTAPDPAAGGSTLIACPTCGKPAGWNSHFGGYMCRDGHLSGKGAPREENPLASYYSDLAELWGKASGSWEPERLLDELHLAARVVNKLLEECERLHDLWSDAAIRLEESQKEAGALREELWHAKESLDFARTKDAEIVRLGTELERMKRERDNALARLGQVYEV